MEPEVGSVKSILNRQHQWVVPIYQRHYEWDSITSHFSKKEAQIPKLWETMEEKALKRLENCEKTPHYFGAIICAEAKKENSGVRFSKEIDHDYLIDGQQRVTSFQIALIAMREVAKLYEIDFIEKEINKYIFNRLVPKNSFPSKDDLKLRSSKIDHPLFEAIALQGYEEFIESYKNKFHPKTRKPKKEAEKLIWAYWTLYQRIKQMVSQQEEKDGGYKARKVLKALLDGFLNDFKVVIIHLEDKDNAQEIFASLNGLGQTLSQFDLVRNDIFLRARKKGNNDWEAQIEREWDYFEKEFWYQEVGAGRNRRQRAEDLIAHVVVAETVQPIGVNKIATEYKLHVESKGYDSVDEEIKILKKHAENYCSLKVSTKDSEGTNPVLGLAKIFDSWNTYTFYPLVLWVCYHIQNKGVRKDIFDLVESFLVRQEICGVIGRSYSKLVLNMIISMRGEKGPVGDPFSALHEYITSLSGATNRMPRDEDIIDAFKRQPQSNKSRRVRHILVRLEYATRGRFSEKVMLDETNLTLEHIMPQSWEENWLLPNGVSVLYLEGKNFDSEKREEIREMIQKRKDVVDTYGNLTLVTPQFNSDLDKKGWAEKRQAIEGESILTLNRKLVKNEVWDEEAIERRAENLANLAIDIWKFTPTS